MEATGSQVFDGKVALIYGAAKGIGRAVAREFARRGAQVTIADIDLEGARGTAELIVADGGTATALRCDVTRDDSVREAAVAAQLAAGEADIVMNNVGNVLHGRVQDIPLSEWQRMWDMNLMPIARSAAYFLPRMIARGSGHIVNTASFAGLYPFATTRMPYVASKAAVIALSQSMALELAPQGVKVSCLCPGPVATGVLDSMKTWSTGVELRGPGKDLEIKSVGEVARTLADGMEAGRILIPTHDEAWDTLARFGADPDGFVHAKMAEFADGDFGRPHRLSPRVQQER